MPDKIGYVSLDRTWKHGDVVEVDFPMAPRHVVADQRVKANAGRMAIERGPIVYCAEWPEADDHRVLDLVVDTDHALTPSVNKDLYGGVTVIAHRSAQRDASRRPRPKPIELIPYHLWANRGAGEMSVWLLMRDYKVGDTGPSGGWIFYENPNYAKDGWRYLEAAPVDQSAGAKWGCFRTPIDRRPRHGHRHRQAEHAGHPHRLRRSRHRGGSVRQLHAQRRRRMVSAVARRARRALSRAPGPRPRRLRRHRPCRQRQLLGLVAADHGHGDPHRFRRQRPRAQRRQGLSEASQSHQILLGSGTRQQVQGIRH